MEKSMKKKQIGVKKLLKHIEKELEKECSEERRQSLLEIKKKAKLWERMEGNDADVAVDAAIELGRITGLEND
jgi:hypothetical protein